MFQVIAMFLVSVLPRSLPRPCFVTTQPFSPRWMTPSLPMTTFSTQTPIDGQKPAQRVLEGQTQDKVVLCYDQEMLDASKKDNVLFLGDPDYQDPEKRRLDKNPHVLFLKHNGINVFYGLYERPCVFINNEQLSEYCLSFGKARLESRYLSAFFVAPLYLALTGPFVINPLCSFSAIAFCGSLALQCSFENKTFLGPSGTKRELVNSLKIFYWLNVGCVGIFIAEGLRTVASLSVLYGYL